MNNNVVITAACRTPIGTMGGCFKSMQPVDLTIPVIRALVECAGINPGLVDDVIWGCNYQRTYKENNLARIATIKAGLPVTVPGITVHRNCTSSMSAVQLAYYQIKADEADCILAGGTDSMSTAPHMAFGLRGGIKFGDLQLRDSMWDSLNNTGVGPAMGITAENLAQRYGITREQQDEFALLSQSRALNAINNNKFKNEIIPVEVPAKGGTVTVDTDEHPRAGLTMEKLAKLKSTFKEGGTVTAGNASGMNDGSAGIVMMSQKAAAESKAPVLARIIATATSGVDPDYMGVGPVESTRMALKKAGLSIDDIGLFELNEAFAAQCIACERELEIPREKLNVNGSGISLGHPVGATGARLIVTLINEMKRTGVKFGLAALCAGGGMGTTVILEHPEIN